MNLTRLNRISDKGSIFLVGPNGAGKSRTLRALCDRKVRHRKGHVIAISNTPYSRLPRYKRPNYSHININSKTTVGILKGLLEESLQTESFALISMREVLQYTGYYPALVVEMKLRRAKGSEEEQRTLQIPPGDWSNEDVQDATRIAENIRDYIGRHVVQLTDVSEFFSRREDLARATKLQNLVNFYLGKGNEHLSISFGLVKGGRYLPLRSASSGELTLITMAMFILSKRQDVESIFIDEPENSMHPQWLMNYFSFIVSLIRRRNVNFFMATHSPVLVTGALSDELSSHIVRCSGQEYSKIMFNEGETDENIERLLWEAFETITPISNFLSETISRLAWEVREAKMTKADAISKVQEYEKKSISEQQRNFLTACRRLIEKI